MEVLSWTTEQLKVLSIIARVTSMLSFLGSSCIIFEILRDRKDKFGKPYFRILFGMSVVDLVGSISMGLTTLPIPAGTGVYGAKGTDGTCTAQGFFNQAIIAGPIYNLMLSIYFLLRVKHGRTDKDISRRVEPIMHAATNGFGLGSALLCLGLGIYDDSDLWCWISAGDKAQAYRWALYYAPLWVCIIGCMAIMIVIFLDVREGENKLKKYSPLATFDSEDLTPELERKKTEEDRRRHKKSRQVAYQSLRFTGAFYLVFTFATVNRLLQSIIGHTYFWLMVLFAIFRPMQGLMNFLVYMYPRWRSNSNSS